MKFKENFQQLLIFTPHEQLQYSLSKVFIVLGKIR